MAVTMDSLEEALIDNGWEPEYRDQGEPLDSAAYEITVGERTLYVEMVDFANDGTLSMVRVCEFDSNGRDFTDAWDLDELPDTETVVSEVRDFIASI